MSLNAAEHEHPPSLAGLRVLVLRPEGQGERLAELLRAEGADPVEVPAVRILRPEDWSPTDAVLETLDTFDWLVFTSVNGVNSFLGRLSARGLSPAGVSPEIAAIGPATRARLEQAGLEVGWVPPSYTTETLAEELPSEAIPRGAPETPSGARRPRICVFRAGIASTELERTLEARGFEVQRVDIYRTEPINAPKIRELLPSVDAVALTSASIADSFATAAEGSLPGTILLVSIGPATSKACRSQGLRVDAEAAEHTVEGVVDALKARWPATGRTPGPATG